MKKLGLAILLLCLGCNAYAQANDPLRAAKAALAGGQPAKAVEILLPLEAERAGNPAYDYLLGLARLDSGDPERAVFALERVLAVEPGHAQARAEIGRAYLQLGERDAGIKELESARKMDVPEEARRTIGNYLNAFGAGPTRLSGYLEASLGYDSNVNSGVSGSRMAIPALGNLEFELSQNGRKLADSFGTLSGGINVAHPLAQGWFLLGSGAFSQRLNSEHARFDTRNFDGNIGLRYAAGANAFTFGLQAQAFDVKEQRNRDALGLVAQWQHQLDAQTQISAFGQFVQLRYPDQGFRDADRSIVGLAYAKVLQGGWTPSFYASVYGGGEKEQKSGVPHFGHTPWGIRFGGQLKPSSTMTWFAHASYEHRRYGGSDPLFLVRRNDNQWDLRLGLNYEPYRYWTISPQISQTRNDSNVAINDYSRTVFSISVRRDF